MKKRFAMAMALLALVAGPARADDDDDDDESIPFGVTTLIIELTDNDIELQVFVDGEWARLQAFDPNDRRLFDARTRGRLRRQSGSSEIFFASEPTHYLEDDPTFDGTIELFLRRFPEGVYGFEGRTLDGREVEGQALLTHVLPARPEIVSPVSDTDDPPVVDIDDLVIEWEPVTTRFLGTGPVEILEYQVIVDQVDPERDVFGIDGKTRRALINVPGSVTSLTVPPEFLVPDAFYEFEVLAIEASGNATISVGEFVPVE